MVLGSAVLNKKPHTRHPTVITFFIVPPNLCGVEQTRRNSA